MKVGRFEVHPVDRTQRPGFTSLGHVVFSRYFDADTHVSMIRAQLDCAGARVATCVREPREITEVFLQTIEAEVLAALKHAHGASVFEVSR